MMHYFLIGIPGSGKTTYARKLAAQLPNATIVSTDAIRARLYGDESILGEWEAIEREMLRQIENAVNTKQTIVYDATNVAKKWRQRFLSHPQTFHLNWEAYIIDTPLKKCQQRNQSRNRVVPDEVLKRMWETLNAEPPTIVEGFKKISRICP